MQELRCVAFRVVLVLSRLGSRLFWARFFWCSGRSVWSRKAFFARAETELDTHVEFGHSASHAGPFRPSARAIETQIDVF